MRAITAVIGMIAAFAIGVAVESTLSDMREDDK